VGGSYQFSRNRAAQPWHHVVLYSYNYTSGVTPAMAFEWWVFVASQYVMRTSGAKGHAAGGAPRPNNIQSGRTEKIPGQRLWSFALNDNQIRSMLQTDQHFASIGSKDKGHRIMATGSVKCLV